MTVTADVPISQTPISQTVRRCIRQRIDQMGLKDGEVARRAGMSASNLSRIISGDVGLDFDKLDRLAKALEVPWYWLAEVEVDKYGAASAWNARYGHPQVLFEKFGEHQRRCNAITSFDRHIVCSQTPKGPHDKRYQALLAELVFIPEGEKMLENFIAFADMRRNRYLACNADTAPRITSILLRSEMDALLNRQFPYNYNFTAADAYDCFNYLINECVKQRGLRLNSSP